MSVTPHRLVRCGEAILVSSVSEALEVLHGPDASIDDRQRQQPSLFDSVSDDEKRVQEALPARRGICVDEVVVATGLRAGSVMVCLARLEDLGLAKETRPGLWIAGRETPV